MKDLPNPFWAALFILMACVLAIVALVHPNVANVTMAVIAIASNIVSGSFGYISGHRDGVASVSIPSQPSPGASTTLTVGPTSTAPLTPAPAPSATPEVLP